MNERGRGETATPPSGAVIEGRGTWLISLSVLIVILVLWEIAGRNKLINPFFLSWPSAIGIEAWKMLENGELAKNLWVTGYAYFIGVISACALGSALGLAMGWWRTFGAVIDPYVVFFSAMPRVALFRSEEHTS